MSTRVLIASMMGGWFGLVAGVAVAQSPAPKAAEPAVPSAAASPTAPTPPSTGDESSQPTMRDDKESIEAAQKWLKLLDDGNSGIAWDVSAKYLKSIVTRAEWIKGIGDARKPFGKLKSRTAEKFARSHSLPGAPDGDYAIIEFASVFANGKKAAEQVIWTFESGDVWRVSGYFIR